LDRKTISVGCRIGFFVSILGSATAASVAQESVPAARVLVAPVVEQAIGNQRDLVGTVLPRRRVIVGSAVDGRVVEYPVVAGQRVAEGEVLTRLLTQTLELELAAADAELQLREAELSELRNGARPAEIAAAEARVASAEATASYAQASFARMQRLRDLGSVSQDEFDQVDRGLKQADQQLAEAKSLRDLVLEGPRPERIVQFEAKVEAQRHLIAQIKDRLEKFTIRAPFDGYIVNEFIDKGAWVKAGDPIVELVQLDPVEVEVFVPEQQIPFIQPNQVAPVQFAALPGQTFTGRVDQIVPLANVQSRTFPVRVVIPNPLDEAELPVIRAGMLASVRLATDRTRRVLLVPKDALRLDLRPLQVVRVIDKAADPVKVEIGASHGGLVEVTVLPGGDLSIGDLLVVRGNEGLNDGDPVEVDGQLPIEAFLQRVSE
jgi:multidrug efflux pump subunit AcrA (membrane-fusion protein)